MHTVKSLMSVSIAVLAVALASPAMSQTVAEEFIYYPSESDEYFFFDRTDRKTVADFKTDKLVRVCVDRNTHLVPLKVYHDDKTSKIAPGDCLRFEAKQVAIEPAKRLEAKWVLKAEVATMKASS